MGPPIPVLVLCCRVSMQCPRCKLLNPDTTARCDCGYDFESRSMQKRHFTNASLRVPGLFSFLPAGVGALTGIATAVFNRADYRSIRIRQSRSSWECSDWHSWLPSPNAVPAASDGYY